jgi:hypothetical protein
MWNRTPSTSRPVGLDTWTLARSLLGWARRTPGPHFAGQADPDGSTNTSQVRCGPSSSLPIVQIAVTASRAGLPQDLGAYEKNGKSGHLAWTNRLEPRAQWLVFAITWPRSGYVVADSRSRETHE